MGVKRIKKRFRSNAKKAFTFSYQPFIVSASMNDWVLLLVVLGGWILLQAVVLPRLGIST